MDTAVATESDLLQPSALKPSLSCDSLLGIHRTHSTTRHRCRFDLIISAFSPPCLRVALYHLFRNQHTEVTRANQSLSRCRLTNLVVSSSSLDPILLFAQAQQSRLSHFAIQTSSALAQSSNPLLRTRFFPVQGGDSSFYPQHLTADSSILYRLRHLRGNFAVTRRAIISGNTGLTDGAHTDCNHLCLAFYVVTVLYGN